MDYTVHGILHEFQNTELQNTGVGGLPVSKKLISATKN